MENKILKDMSLGELKKELMILRLRKKIDGTMNVKVKHQIRELVRERRIYENQNAGKK